MARIEECLPSLPTHTLDRPLRCTWRLGHSGDGTTLLHLASGVGLPDLARRVLAQRADVGQEHRAFGPPLLLAAERGHVDVARLLLERGAEVMQATKTGITALHAAAGRGHEDMLRAPWMVKTC